MRIVTDVSIKNDNFIFYTKKLNKDNLLLFSKCFFYKVKGGKKNE